MLNQTITQPKTIPPPLAPEATTIVDEFSWQNYIATQEVDVQKFCRRWWELENLPECEIEKIESQRGYRAKVVRLLASVLNLAEHTVNLWGKGFKLPSIPTKHYQTLAIALIVKQSAQTNVISPASGWNATRSVAA